MFEKQGKIMFSRVNDIYWTTKIKTLHMVTFWAPFYFAALCIVDRGLQLLTTALIISL